MKKIEFLMNNVRLKSRDSLVEKGIIVRFLNRGLSSMMYGQHQK